MQLSAACLYLCDLAPAFERLERSKTQERDTAKVWAFKAHQSIMFLLRFIYATEKRRKKSMGLHNEMVEGDIWNWSYGLASALPSHLVSSALASKKAFNKLIMKS